MISASSLSGFSVGGSSGVSAPGTANNVLPVRALSGNAATAAAKGSGTLRFNPNAPQPTQALPRGSLLNLSV